MEPTTPPRSLGAYQAALSSLTFGKVLPTAVYLVDDPEFPIPETLRTIANRLRERLTLGPEFNVLKWSTRELKLSFLSYPTFRDEAHPALEEAVSIDLASGQVRLGQLLSRNEPTPEQLCESGDWFRRAADLGDSGGMTSLGFAYREGRGVPIDERKAADWFIKAYSAGAKHASELAGRLLSHRPENHGEAVRWLRVAVEHGCDSAYYNLALMHEDRRSPVYDPEEAYRCWIQVAERPRGNLRFMAMFTLARCCRDGIGTERNRENAIAWLDRLLAIAPAEKADYRDAAKLKQQIEGDLL